MGTTGTDCGFPWRRFSSEVVAQVLPQGVDDVRCRGTQAGLFCGAGAGAGVRSSCCRGGARGRSVLGLRSSCGGTGGKRRARWHGAAVSMRLGVLPRLPVAPMASNPVVCCARQVARSRLLRCYLSGAGFSRPGSRGQRACIWRHPAAGAQVRIVQVVTPPLSAGPVRTSHHPPGPWAACTCPGSKRATLGPPRRRDLWPWGGGTRTAA